MADVKFGYLDEAGDWHPVTTLEEDEYPTYYHQNRSADVADEAAAPSATGFTNRPADEPVPAAPQPEPLFEGHREFQENQRGVSFETLLLPYLRDATEITVTDPYIRQFHQARNLMELIEAIAAAKDPADVVTVKLVTSEHSEGEDKIRKQLEFLLRVKQAAEQAGVTLDVSLKNGIHDRSIVTDTGWRINLGRGLDIFQYFGGDAFDLATKLQEYRQVKAFGVTYMCDLPAP